MTRTPRSYPISFLDLGVWLLPPPTVVRVNNHEPSDGGFLDFLNSHLRICFY